MLGAEELSPSYFIEAANHFLEDFPDKQIYFVAVSDEPAWILNNLVGKIPGLVVVDNHLEHQTEDNLKPAAGRKDHDLMDPLSKELDNKNKLDLVGRDLALLAACNHTIISQGMFGAWGAFLAGGDMYTKYGVLVQDVLG